MQDLHWPLDLVPARRRRRRAYRVDLPRPRFRRGAERPARAPRAGRHARSAAARGAGRARHASRARRSSSAKALMIAVTGADKRKVIEQAIKQGAGVALSDRPRAGGCRAAGRHPLGARSMRHRHPGLRRGPALPQVARATTADASTSRHDEERHEPHRRRRHRPHHRALARQPRALSRPDRARARQRDRPPDARLRQPRARLCRHRGGPRRDEGRTRA